MKPCPQILKYWIVGTALLLLAALQLQAQVRLTTGSTFPDAPANHEWFYDSLKGNIHWCQDGNWTKLIAATPKKVVTFGNVLKVNFPSYKLACFFAPELQRVIVDTILQRDSVTILLSADRQIYVGPAGILSLLDTKPYKHLKPTRIQGMEAYVLPLYLPLLTEWSANEVRVWGMLGCNGKWLIEPKFDGPFVFRNGFAEVLHYGQRKRINEKGEFVE